MHLDFIADGRNEELDKMEKWLSTRILPMATTDKKGKKGEVKVPSQLRSRRAYSLVFPKENLDVILNALKPEICSIAKVDGKGTKILSTTFNMIRKLLRLKKIPTPDKNKGVIALPRGLLDNIRIVGLGIREDIDIVEDNGVMHEGL